MTTANHSTNQQPHGLGNLVQITEDQTKHNPNPWVLVEQAGTDDENIREDFATFRAASLAMKDYYYRDELETLNVQIMRRNEDGTLTAKF